MLMVSDSPTKPESATSLSATSWPFTTRRSWSLQSPTPATWTIIRSFSLSASTTNSASLLTGPSEGPPAMKISSWAWPSPTGADGLFRCVPDVMPVAVARM